MAKLSATLSLSQPMTRAVYQRNPQHFAMVPVIGACDCAVSRVEARWVEAAGTEQHSGEWCVVSDNPSGNEFHGALRIPSGGWHRVEVRTFGPSGLIAKTSVDKVGVGEVFITAGQSNAANSGDVRTTPKDDRISAWTGDHWQFAADPQPGATNTLGSPWPSMADWLVDMIGVPVGLIAVAVGGTPIRDWLHTGTYDVTDCYSGLQRALTGVASGGVRAVLWHQGETDTQQATPEDVYAERLGTLIAMSRRDAGWEIPWFVARASWFGTEEFRANQPAIRAAQNAVCDGKTILPGPDTDELGDEYRSAADHAHFNEKGLREHGRLWAVVISEYLRAGFRL
jgi:eukaryotic-like serine/threonine-protein kinase